MEEELANALRGPERAKVREVVKKLNKRGCLVLQNLGK